MTHEDNICNRLEFALCKWAFRVGFETMNAIIIIAYKYNTIHRSLISILPA